MKKKKGNSTEALQKAKWEAGVIKELTHRYWAPEDKKRILKVIREAAIRTIKLITRVIKEKKDKKDEDR